MFTLRPLTLSVVAALAAGTLAACGTTESTDSDAGAGGAGYPVTLPNTFGETTIEEKPKRIVTLGWNAQDIVYALGETPVGSPEITYGQTAEGISPWTEEYFDPADTELFAAGANFSIPLEKVASMRPDVILAPYEGFDQKVYDKLSDIAPTVAYPGKAWQTSWQDQTMIVGEALGKKAEAQKLVDDTQKSIKGIAQDHPEFEGKTVTVASFGEQDYVYMPSDPRVQILNEMGFETSPGVDALAKADETGEFALEISKEQLADIDADVLVGYADGVGTEDIFDSEVYQSIPSVKDDSAYLLDDVPVIAAMSSVSVLSIPWVSDQLVPGLSKAASS